MSCGNFRKCPCPTCQEQKRAEARDYMRAYRATGPRTTDARPIAWHIGVLLAQGMTLAGIAARAGYSHDTLASISSGRVRRVRTTTAEDLLSIPVRSAAA